MRLDRVCRIFRLEGAVNRVSGEVVEQRNYLEDGNLIKTTFRELSSNEKAEQKSANDVADAVFYFQPRNLDTQCFIEIHRAQYGNELYKVTGVDPFRDKARSLYKVRAQRINATDIVEGSV